MEGVAVSLYKGIKWYCKCKTGGYIKLNESSSPRTQRHKRFELASNVTRRRRFWRFKVSPKIKSFKIVRPNKFLVYLRDAYVSMMLSMANKRVFSSNYYSGGVISHGFGRYQLKEYDDKMIMHIYKSLVVSRCNVVSGSGSQTL